MAEQGPIEHEIDAEIEDPPRVSWILYFLKGTVYGFVMSAIAIVALFLVTTPNGHIGSGATVVSGPPVAAATPEPDAEPFAAEPEPEVTQAPEPPEPEAVPETVIAPREPDGTQDVVEDAADSPATATAGADTGENDSPEEETAPAEDPAVAEAAGETQAVEETAEAAAPDAPADETELAALAQPEPEPQPEPVATAPALTGPAMEVNAQPFETDFTDKLLSVVLLDAGRGGLDTEQLTAVAQGLTLPITLALRPGTEMHEFGTFAHDAGYEVLAILPAGDGEGEALRAGLPEDEVRRLTDLWMANLDMAIGAFVPNGTGAGTDRRVMGAVLGALGDHGFAYVDDRRIGGQGPASSIAEALKLPYLPVTGPLVGAADSAVIRKVLNDAVEAARRGSTAVVFLPGERESLQTLVSWRLEGANREVKIVPLSAVIRRRSG